MRFISDIGDYELLDATLGEKLERWGEIMLVRPDPQIVWQTPRVYDWDLAHAHYVREKSGGGFWDCKKDLPESWSIKYKDLTFKIKPTGFKHTGLFPEQAVNWEFMSRAIKTAGRPIKVLNLFAYTGGATAACAAAGAQVCHVDASKGMVAWAKDNFDLSGLSDKPIRRIVDDCLKFLEREQRRGNTYDAIVMDPPSYGRGPGGEVWQLEEKIYELVSVCANLLSDNPLFFMLNSYTTGLGPSVMSYLLASVIRPRLGGEVTADEIGLPVTASGLVLPCGNTAIWQPDGR